MKENQLKIYSKKQAAELIKIVAGAITKAPKGEGTFEVIASTEGMDRDGEVILVTAWDLKRFNENPVVLFGHDYWSFPIGAVTSIEIVDGKLVAKGVFARTEQGQIARQLYDDGILKAVSVGFIVKNREGNKITEAELLELSFVPVPSNADALSLAKMQKLETILKTSIVKKEDEPDGVAAGVNDASADQHVEPPPADEPPVSEPPVEPTKEQIEAQIQALLSDENLTDEERTAKYNELKEQYEKVGGEMPELKTYTRYELDKIFPALAEKNESNQQLALDSLEIVQDLTQDIKSLLNNAAERIAASTGNQKNTVKPMASQGQKDGRTLSAKTRNAISNSIESMTKALKDLKALLDEADAEKNAKPQDDAFELLKALQGIDKVVETAIVTVKTRLYI